MANETSFWDISGYGKLSWKSVLTIDKYALNRSQSLKGVAKFVINFRVPGALKIVI